MYFLTSRHIVQLVLNYSVHFSYRIEDAAGELFLVVDARDPLGQHLGDLWLQNLCNLQLNQGLSVQNLEVLLLLGFFSKSLNVPCCIRHLSEDCFWVSRCSHVIWKVCGNDHLLASGSLEAFHSSIIDNGLDHMKALHKT